MIKHLDQKIKINRSKIIFKNEENRAKVNERK